MLFKALTDVRKGSSRITLHQLRNNRAEQPNHLNSDDKRMLDTLLLGAVPSLPLSQTFVEGRLMRLMLLCLPAFVGIPTRKPCSCISSEQIILEDLSFLALNSAPTTFVFTLVPFNFSDDLLASFERIQGLCSDDYLLSGIGHHPSSLPVSLRREPATASLSSIVPRTKPSPYPFLAQGK